MARAGADGVRVRQGDGYAGVPGEHFDRVIVTVGVTGVSPRWIEQLLPGGLVIAPIEHAGFHPVHAVRAAEGPVTGAVVSSSGFMVAAGPLTADHPDAFPTPAAAGSLDPLTEAAGPRFSSPLDGSAYRDLWYATGVWHRRATHAAVLGRDQGCLVLLDEARTGGAVILPDGSVLAGGEQADAYAMDAATVLDRWLAADRPSMAAWRVGFAPAGDPNAPILVPRSWNLSGAGAGTPAGP